MDFRQAQGVTGITGSWVDHGPVAGASSVSAAPAQAAYLGGRPRGGHRVGSLLVVDPPADEIGPRVGRVALDREVDLSHPGDRVEELLVAQAYPAVWVG